MMEMEQHKLSVNYQLVYDSLYLKYKWTLITEISRDLRMYMHRMIPEIECLETSWKLKKADGFPSTCVKGIQYFIFNQKILFLHFLHWTIIWWTGIQLYPLGST